MAGQFYLTLPSNSSMEYFPGNTLTSFKTKLAQPIELTGEWEVALSEFQYPRSWYNLRDFDNHIYYDSGGQGSIRQVLSLMGTTQPLKSLLRL